MGTLWEDLVGSKVGDGYLLRSMIGSTERSAVYQTFYGEYGAAIKLAAIEDAAPVIPPLDHPRIIGLFASGRCVVSDTPLQYFVTEAAEENLGSIVAARALTPDEAVEMLKPVLDALTYLHGRGLAHGSIKPGNILAHGDSVKLSVDSIRTAGAVASPEDDMRELGLTIIEVLTQERQPSAIADIPQPLRDIVEHSLLPGPQLRWTAAQAATRLSGKMPVQVTPTPPPGSAAVAEAPSPIPVTEGPPASSVNPSAKPRQRVPFWALPATAAVMLMAVIYVLARGTGQPSDSSMAASAPAPTVSVPAPAVNTPPPAAATPSRPQPVFHPKPSAFEPPQRAIEKAVPKPVTKTAPASASSKTTPKTSATARGWFVVSASYTKEEDAAHQANVLGRKFPNFKPSVFPPSAIDTHYLVILGSGLSSEGAEALRQRAVASGLPPDTYIKKYPSRAP